MAGELEQEEAGLVCIGCGCTENTACPGGCHWARVNREKGVGVCTAAACLPKVAEWDQINEPNDLEVKR